MKAIRLVSSVHVLWGLCLVSLWVPRPFGALEPFFAILSPFWVGVCFVLAGSLPLITLRVQWFKCLLCAVVPQQIILFYGLLVSGRDVVTTGDVRIIMALCYLGPMTFYHAREGISLWALAWSRADGNGRLDD